MSNTTTSTNMGLTIPSVSVDPGPDWANNLNASLTTIDAHNHSSGQGVQIQPNGLNINSDLTFASNNATNLKSARFTAQSVAIPNSGSNVGCLYVSGNEIYFNDVTGGHQVQITNAGSVNAGAGSISGLPSGTASAAFSGGTFTWQSATSTAANIDGGSFILRNATASSHSLTLQPPAAMAANIIETLPTIPAAPSFMQMDASGNMSASIAVSQGIVSSNIALGTIVGGNLTSNIDLPGKLVKAASLNIIVSNTNPSVNGLSLVRGLVAPSGIITGEGFSFLKVGVGDYGITYTTPFADSPAVTVTPSSTAGFGISGAITINPTVSGFTLLIYNSANALIDVNFSFIAIGSRA